MEKPFKWTKELKSIFSEDRLGHELLKDPKGELPILAWKLYFRGHSDQWLPVLNWCLDPSHPDLVPTDPQQAVDDALPLVGQVTQHLRSHHPAKALKAAEKALDIMVHAASFLRPQPGQPASTQRMAVRAYIIRKFSRHPGKPRESIVRLHKLADMLFVSDGKCSRCGLSKHQYSSPCVKALRTAVTRLKAAMKRDGIPT